MRVVILFLLFTMACKGQYYFSGKAISDTFFYAGRSDVFGTPLPSFTYPPSVILQKNSMQTIITREEENYFVVSIAGAYDFIVNQAPTKKVYPQGEIKIGRGFQWTITHDTDPLFLFKNDTIISAWLELDATGDTSIVAYNYMDINYFETNIDTIGSCPANTAGAYSDTHYDPSITLIGDTIYIVYGFHDNYGRAKKFRYNNVLGMYVAVDSMNSGNDSYPVINHWGDSLAVSVRVGGSTSKIHKMITATYPVIASSKTVVSFADSVWYSYCLFNRVFSGTEMHAAGFYLDITNGANGLNNELNKNLLYMRFADNYNSIYNVRGNNLTAQMPFNELEIDSFALVQTDTFYCLSHDIVKSGNYVYIWYAHERATADTLDHWLAVINLLDNTYTLRQSNLWSLAKLDIFEMWLDDGYVYLLGGLHQTGSFTQWAGDIKIYRARLQSLEFSEYYDIGGNSIGYGKKIFSPGGKSVFFAHTKGIAGNHSEIYVKMYRDL